MVSELPRCAECGVPEYVSQENAWLSDGSIVHARLPETRLVFLETENWDPVWSSISALIGVPIERIIVDASRKAARTYTRQLVNEEVLDMMLKREIPLESVFQMAFTVARVLGTSDPSVVEARFEGSDDDYAVVRFRNPFSIPMMVGMFAGTVEAYTGLPLGVTYDKVPPDSIEVRVFKSEHPEELQGRLRFKPHHAVEGGIHLERCPGCGVPSAVCEYGWDVDAGVISSSATGRRMTLSIGPSMVDSIFLELEDELGEDVLEITVESQRRFVRNGPYTTFKISDENNMRRELALRGLGELTSLKMSGKGLEMNLEHTTMHLWVAGLMQGLYEQAVGEEGLVEWEFSDDARLKLNVTRR